MSDIRPLPEHPNNIKAREARERQRMDAEVEERRRVRAEGSQAAIDKINAGVTPSPNELHHLERKAVVAAAWCDALQVRVDAGLLFEHPSVRDPPPKDGESFLIVFTDARGRTCIEPANWEEEDDWWCTDNEVRRNNEIYAVLRIPAELSEAQRMFVDGEKADAEIEDAR